MRRAIAALLLIVACSMSGRAADRPAPRVVAHRGLLRHAPECTLAAFRACLALRIGFEFDVRRSEDGVLVCVHDDTLDRTTDGTGPVAGATLAELQKLDAGSWFDPRFRGERIPTIDEIFAALARHPSQSILAAADLKVAGVETEVVALANKHGVLDRVLFIGTTIRDDDVRRALRKSDRKSQTACVANTADELAAAIADEHSDWVYVRYVASRSEITRIHEAGKRAFIAGPTVAGREVENWGRVTANGIDAVLTDYPLDLARESVPNP